MNELAGMCQEAMMTYFRHYTEMRREVLKKATETLDKMHRL
jgi:hypothetical protein